MEEVLLFLIHLNTLCVLSKICQQGRSTGTSVYLCTVGYKHSSIKA